MKNSDTKLPYAKLASIWIVGLATLLLTIGYLVTPILFSELSQNQAGKLAGLLFNKASLIVLGSLFLLVGFYAFYKKRLKLVKSLLLSLGLLMILRFWISPWMADIKALYPLGIDKNSADWILFASLHGAYQVGYLAIILLLFYWGLKALFGAVGKPS
ncbi:MAG: DUF4149 domain-containing protein [Pseudomonadota bacterium]